MRIAIQHHVMKVAVILVTTLSLLVLIGCSNAPRSSSEAPALEEVTSNPSQALVIDGVYKRALTENCGPQALEISELTVKDDRLSLIWPLLGSCGLKLSHQLTEEHARGIREPELLLGLTQISFSNVCSMLGGLSVSRPPGVSRYSKFQFKVLNTAQIELRLNSENCVVLEKEKDASK